MKRSVAHNTLSCPFCLCERIIRKGKDQNGGQRYACKACAGVWTEATWEKLHTKRGRLIEALKMVEEGALIVRAAEATGYSRETIRKYLKLKRRQG